MLIRPWRYPISNVSTGTNKYRERHEEGTDPSYHFTVVDGAASPAQSVSEDGEKADLILKLTRTSGNLTEMV